MELMDAAQQQPCPRCNSLDTKFCYYNNYNPSQPRYRCKNCRRYWTLGGTLRDVPVGGGHRRRRRRYPTVENPPPRSTAQPHPLQNQPGQLNPVSAPAPAPGPSNALVSETPMIPSIASASSMQLQAEYPVGGFLPSMPTIDQSYDQLMNVDGDFGVSGWSMLQGFGFPSFNPQPPQGNPNNSHGSAWAPSGSNGGNPGGGLF